MTKFHRALTSIAELGQRRKQAGGLLLNGLPQIVFVRLLLWACEREVAEPVDRIWALTGLSQPALQSTLAPLVDYSKDARSKFYQTYKAFAQVFLLQDERLWLLSLISETPPPRHEKLPSWCPSFAHSSEKTHRYILQETNINQYHAGFLDAEPLKPRVRFPPATDHLAVYGFVIDSAVAVRTHGGNFEKESRVSFDKLCRNLADETYGDRNQAFEAHSRTIIVDQRVRAGTSGPHEVSTSQVAEIYTKWRRHLEGIVEFRTLGEIDKAKVRWFNESAAWAGMHRCYIGTKFGRVGLAPIGTVVGDLICILYGATTPFLIRRERRGSKTTLVGDAYIHGVMNGEALSMPSRKTLEEEFVIS